MSRGEGETLSTRFELDSRHGDIFFGCLGAFNASHISVFGGSLLQKGGSSDLGDDNEDVVAKRLILLKIVSSYGREWEGDQDY